MIAVVTLRHLGEIPVKRCLGTLGIMKTGQQRTQEAGHRRTEAIAERHLSALFERMPMLSGFTLQENLEVTDVATFTWPGYAAGEDLYKDLMLALADLAEERPDAIDLLRGRTFARAVH